MQKIVALSFFSRLTHETRRPSPKNYPKAKIFKLIGLLRDQGFKTVQIGVTGEEDIGADEFKKDLSFPELVAFIKTTSCVIAVDNAIPHLCAYHKLGPLIVLWGPSDPKLFGYEENINLLKDKKYLREAQYMWWEECKTDPEAFVEPEIVLESVNKLIAEKEKSAGKWQ